MARPAPHLRRRSATAPAGWPTTSSPPASAPTPSGPSSAATSPGQDHLACYLHNGNEYLEAMLGSYKARVAPFNVNYRYVAEELRYLLNDAGARAMVFHSAFADRVAEVLPDLPRLEVLLQVDDGSGAPLLPGRHLVRGRAGRGQPGAARGGVEPGRPLHPLHGRHHRHAQGRAVAPGRHLRRRHGRPEPGHRRGVGVARGDRRGRPATAAPACCPRRRSCTAPATGWRSTRFTGGNTVVVQDDTVGFDPDDVWRTVEREHAAILLIVGDAFGRPLIDQLEASRPRRRRLRPVVAAHGDLRRGSAELHPQGPVPRPAPHRDGHGRRRRLGDRAARWPT